MKPNFIVWEKEEYIFYAGYCIKFDGDLHWLAKQLNSEDMEFYIKYVGRDYQNGYKSYAKSFISNFGIIGYENKKNITNLHFFKIGTVLRLTQHKRFVPYGAHPNFCSAKTSFMLETLGDIDSFQSKEWRTDMETLICSFTCYFCFNILSYF